MLYRKHQRKIPEKLYIYRSLPSVMAKIATLRENISRKYEKREREKIGFLKKFTILLPNSVSNGFCLVARQRIPKEEILGDEKAGKGW